MFKKKVPDYFITVFVFISGLAVIIFLVINGHSPIIPFYFWLKAVTVDVLRIKRKQALMMPGFVYFVYGLQLVTFWMASDLLYNNPLTKLGEAGTVKHFLLFANPALFWLIIETVTSIGLIPFTLFNARAPKGQKSEYYLVIDSIRALLSFVLVIFTNLLFLILP